jgi:hypothetical protein
MTTVPLQSCFAAPSFRRVDTHLLMIRNRPIVADIDEPFGELSADRPTVQLNWPPSLLRENGHPPATSLLF